MAKLIPEILNQLSAILKAMDATIAWRKLENAERPGGITPMGVLSDDSLEDLDTLFGRFIFLYAEACQRLLTPRVCGTSAEECAAWQGRLKSMGERFGFFMSACPSRAICRL